MGIISILAEALPDIAKPPAPPPAEEKPADDKGAK